MPQPHLLLPDDAADILGLTGRQVARMVNSGELPSIEVRPGERRVPYHLLLEWIDVRTHNPDDLLIGLGQAAEALGVNVAMVERVCVAGLLKHRRIGTGELLVSQSDVIRLLRRLNAADGEAMR